MSSTILRIHTGAIIASAIGDMPNDATIEILLRARGDTITALELEPFNGALLPARIPILESIRPYPEELGDADDDETTALDGTPQSSVAACRFDTP